MAAMAVLSTNNGRFIKVEDQAAMAALSIRSGQMASQRPGRAIFRKSWRSEWPLYQTGQPQRPLYQGRPASMAVLATAARFIKGEGQASGRDGRFINQKRTNGQISGFGARIVIFTISRIKNLLTAEPRTNFGFRAKTKWPFYQGSSSQMIIFIEAN